MVLVGLCVECCDLALAEGVVQHIVETLRVDAKTRSGNSVNVDRHGIAIRQLVRGEVLQLR